MSDTYHWVIDGTAPLSDLERILEYLWETEIKDYAASRGPTHIFVSLAAVANWLNTSTDWTPDQFVTAWEAGNREGWKAAGMWEPGWGYGSGNVEFGTERFSPPPPNPVFWAPTHPESLDYRLDGNGGSHFVTLGWDRLRKTFHANVWTDPNDPFDEPTHVLRLGWSLVKYTEVHELAAALREYAFIPRDLRERLEEDRDRPETTR